MGAIFDDELKRLWSHLMEMRIDASEQIYQATKAFTDHDADLADKVLTADIKINDEEIRLEKQALKLMALQNPIAADFRKIISILKTSTDIERLGDYSTHIARAAITLSKFEHHEDIEQPIEQMMMIVRKTLERILDAYVYIDEQVAYEVANEDLKVDLLRVKLQKEVMRALVKGGEDVKAYESYLAVIRNLERAGDHIVNLAEWIIYSGPEKLVELNPGKADPTLVRRKLTRNQQSNKKQSQGQRVTLRLLSD